MAVITSVLGAAWGALAFPMYAVAVAYTNDLADPGDCVTISSGLLLVYGIGAVVGPFLASVLISVLGSNMLFVYAAGTHGLLLVFALARLIGFRSVRHEEQVEFGDALTAAQTASRVYEEEVWHVDETESVGEG